MLHEYYCQNSFVRISIVAGFVWLVGGSYDKGCKYQVKKSIKRNVWKSDSIIPSSEFYYNWSHEVPRKLILEVFKTNKQKHLEKIAMKKLLIS